MWVKRYDDIPVSSFTADEFYPNGSYIDYGGTQYQALRGIDVSEHQGVIDWQAVRATGATAKASFLRTAVFVQISRARRPPG